MIDTDKMKALAHRVLDTMDQPDNEAFERARYQYRAATHPERILELLAALEAAAAYKQKMAGLLKRIPQTPQQAIDFIGSQYSSMEADGWEADLSTPTGDLSNVRYVLTVHDLLSAFSWNGLDDAEALSQRQEES
ncbi:hypothetical protein QZN62_10605 [Burkholderia multivorans]|nr:hypothetical protein [Burkholderia multivorans]